MRPGWIIGLLCLWLFLNLVNGICEVAWVSGDTESKMQTLMDMPAAEEMSLFGFGDKTSYFTVGFDSLEVLWDMAWFDYAFFTGPWVFLRLFFIAIGFAIIFIMILSYLRGVSA